MHNFEWKKDYRIKGSFTNYVYKTSLQVVQKCPVFVNIHTTENVNKGGKVVKKAKNLST